MRDKELWGRMGSQGGKPDVKRVSKVKRGLCFQTLLCIGYGTGSQETSSLMESGVQRQCCKEPGYEAENSGEEIEISSQHKAARERSQLQGPGTTWVPVPKGFWPSPRWQKEITFLPQWSANLFPHDCPMWQVLLTKVTCKKFTHFLLQAALGLSFVRMETALYFLGLTGHRSFSAELGLMAHTCHPRGWAGGLQIQRLSRL